MKKLSLFLVIGLFAGVYSCKPKEAKVEEAPLIERKSIELKSDLMTPEVLWSFGRLSEPELSPDKKTVLYGATYYDLAQNKGNRELYTIGVDGQGLKRLTETKFSEYQAMWSADGKKIFFMSSETGTMQLWEMNPDGNGRKQITKVENGINGYKVSPDMKLLLYTTDVFPEKQFQDLYSDLPKASGRIYNDLMYRHWDTWVQSYSHIFVAGLTETINKGKDILFNEPYESPLMPFGGMEQINWSPDSKVIAYTCRKKKGVEYTKSTNSDIYLYQLDNGQTTNITDGMMGYDVAPVFSPDGKKIAWQSMERDGYESDKNRLFVLDLTTKEKTDFTKNFDQNVEGLVWTDDNKSIYFISDWHATDEIYRLDLADGKIARITLGIHNYTGVIPAGDKLITTRVSMSMPAEIYSVNPSDGQDTQITFTNKDILGKLSFGNVKQRWIKTTDNKEMFTWIIYPPHFDSTKKYPTLLYCEGGPQSTVSQFWSYRWNFQMMAANGYIIVAPNRRGLPGFGQEWLEQISGDYGGQNMNDYLSAIDALSKEPYVNKDKLGCVGASYGGFSVYWMAGNHKKRFKAFIAHDGMFNLESQYLETEEMWFVNWDLGGPFWDKNNKTAQRSFANSPHRFVQNWDTPILCIHGELDYRIVATQGMQAFNAAILRGIPAELLYFPDENHWVLKPQNGVLWQRTFFNWLDKWLK
ncbi:MAG: S9 family peptidase [Bacteroidales bacterium]|jgi:dipeptidyl aminopeptidase/acylaminoacyl peptidase|nr:S9 family peptidase [Bacteroidales bacterium]